MPDGRGSLGSRGLQATLRDSIEQLEPDLDIIDGGTERSVASGFIDMTAQACDGTIAFEEGAIPSIANACSLIGECEVGRLTHLKHL